MEIKKITMEGEVSISFSNKMYIPSDFSVINGQTRDTRQLQDLDWIKDFLELRLMNSLENETPRNLEFYWNATNFDRSSMTIQCYFEDSVYVSSERDFD